MTTPVFIVGSGRNGSEAVVRLLGHFDNVEVYHEFMVHYVQPLGTKYYVRGISHTSVIESLSMTHEAAVNLSEKDFWVDSSNKLSWIIWGLKTIFPKAKFIHLLRDGRRVVSSYYHKLADECYADKDVKILIDWLNTKSTKRPPPMKKYWWPIPIPTRDEFRNYNRFQRICWHWQEVNKVILDDLANVSPERRLTIKLEDLVSNEKVYSDFLRFIGLPVRPNLFELLKRPSNVRWPQSYPLTDEQTEQFSSICGDMMKELGYTGPDYEVRYLEEDRPIGKTIYDY